MTVAQMPLSNEVHAVGDSQASLALVQTGVTLKADGWTKKAVAEERELRRRSERANRGERDGWGAIVEQSGKG